MLVARLNRDKLRRLSESRLEEAGVLLEHKLWTGAYYMTGLAIECALKANLAQAVQQHDLPDRSFINRIYTHQLEELAKLDGDFWKELQSHIQSDERLRANWNTVRLWNDENRYEVVDQLVAASLYEAVIEPETGVWQWIRRKWR